MVVPKGVCWPAGCFSDVTIYLMLCDLVSHWTWTFLIVQAFQTVSSRAPSISNLHTSAGITGASRHAWLFTWVWGSVLRWPCLYRAGLTHRVAYPAQPCFPWVTEDSVTQVKVLLPWTVSVSQERGLFLHNENTALFLVLGIESGRDWTIDLHHQTCNSAVSTSEMSHLYNILSSVFRVCQHNAEASSTHPTPSTHDHFVAASHLDSLRTFSDFHLLWQWHFEPRSILPSLLFFFSSSVELSLSCGCLMHLHKHIQGLQT